MYIIKTPRSLQNDNITANSTPQNLPISLIRSSPIGSKFKLSFSSRKLHHSSKYTSKDLKRTLNLKLTSDTHDTLKPTSYLINSSNNFHSLSPSSVSKLTPRITLSEINNTLKQTPTVKRSKAKTKNSSPTFRLTQIKSVKVTSFEVQTALKHDDKKLSKGFALFHKLYDPTSPKASCLKTKESLPKLRIHKSRIILSSTIPHKVSSVHRNSKVLKSLLRKIDILGCETPFINHQNDDLFASFSKKAEQEKSMCKSDIENLTIEKTKF